MKYEQTVERVCGDNWRETCDDERDGGYAVACVMAYMDNSRPGLEDIAKHLGVSPGEIDIAYRRLQASGVFSHEYNARRDPALNGYGNPVQGRTAWSVIAGIGSGYVGQGYYIRRQSNSQAFNAIPSSPVSHIAKKLAGTSETPVDNKVPSNSGKEMS